MKTGAYPIDPESKIGRFRILAQDSTPVSVDNIGGTAEYRLWSDVEVEVLLSESDSLYRALSHGFMGLASAAAMESKSVKDYDLQVDLTRRAGDLRRVAEMWGERADGVAAATGNDFFALYDTVPAETGGYVEAVYGRYPR